MPAPFSEEHCPLPLPCCSLRPGLRCRQGVLASLLVHALLLASLGAWAFSPETKPVVICQLSLVALGTGAGTKAATGEALQDAKGATDKAMAAPAPTAESAPQPTPSESHRPVVSKQTKPQQPRPQKPAKAPAPRPKEHAATTASPQPQAAQASQNAQSGQAAAPAGSQGQTAKAEGAVKGEREGQEAVFSVQSVDSMPKMTRRATPSYPPRARKEGIEGRVLVRMVVDAQGLPTGLAVHSAHPAGHFEEAALEAAARLRFTPGKKAGQAVRVLVLVPFDFRLR